MLSPICEIECGIALRLVSPVAPYASKSILRTLIPYKDYGTFLSYAAG